MKIKTGYLFIAPAFISFMVFSLYPILRSLQLSLYDAGVMKSTFVGFKNFVTIFQSERIVKGFINTFKFTIICAPMVTVLSLIIALLGFRMNKFIQSTIRFVYYIPILTAGPIISMVWAWMFRTGGLINAITGTKLTWLANDPLAFYAICIILITSDLGLNIIIYMAGMSGIDSDIYDAAKLDGCNEIQEDWYITIPQIWHTVGFILFIKIVAISQIWQYPYLLTGGGPYYSTTTAVLEIYNQAFEFGKYGFASAIGVIFVVCVSVISFIQKRFFKGA